jgi:hypothetical protein
MIRTNLIVSIDEDTVSGDTSVLNLKTTDAGNIILECSVPKVAIKLEDLEEAIVHLRSFFIKEKHIDAVAKELSDTQVVDTNQLTFEYNAAE